ncbi:hypothetical protein CRUP_022381 [Coryphaenoides rupestris]|nr:hypothetical protein CRUP_022381 [Coryphaenoides rupestris]
MGLKNAFTQYGTVLKADVVRDRETNKSRGFGFVTFENPQDARRKGGGRRGEDCGGSGNRSYNTRKTQHVEGEEAQEPNSDSPSEVEEESSGGGSNSKVGPQQEAHLHLQAHQRKKREEEGRRVLEQAKGSTTQGKPGNPCGEPRRRENGHAFYNGEFYCPMEQGCSGVAGRPPVPWTTLWNMKKRWKEREASGKKPRKTPKIKTCQNCGQPSLKVYVHSQHIGPRGKNVFCALFEYKCGAVARRKESQEEEEEEEEEEEGSEEEKYKS